MTGNCPSDGRELTIAGNDRSGWQLLALSNSNSFDVRDAQKPCRISNHITFLFDANEMLCNTKLAFRTSLLESYCSN